MRTETGNNPVRHAFLLYLCALIILGSGCTKEENDIGTQNNSFLFDAPSVSDAWEDSTYHFSDATTTRFGQITGITTTNNQKTTSLWINPQQWLTGRIGEQTKREDGLCSYTEQEGPCLPNGFYIRESIGIRELVIDHNVEFLLYDRVRGAPTGTYTRINFEQFKRLWKQSEKNIDPDNMMKSYYFFEFQGGKLKRIIEKYIP